MRAVSISFFLGVVALALLCPVSAVAQGASTSLDRIVMEIGTQQIVGRTLIGNARLLLYGVESLQVDYDLSLNKITMSATNGGMLPGVLNNPLWCDSGIIDLAAIGMRYSGPSGLVQVTATNDSGVNTTSPIISFNGYDILQVFDFKYDPFTHLFSGHPVTARAVVRNGGSLRAETNPSLRSSFKSGGGSVRVFFSPDDSGAVDTIPITLNTTGLASGLDTLVLELEATYRIDTTLYTSRFVQNIPMIIYPLASIDLQNNALSPDSVYAGAEFPLGLSINAPGFEGPIDSNYLKVDLLYGLNDAQSTTIFEGTPDPTSVLLNVIDYTNLPARISLAAGLLPGWYHLRTNYSLISGASVFSLTNLVADSIYILPFTSPQYVPETFAPETVAAGGFTSFRFDLSVTDVDSLLIDPVPGRATLTVVSSTSGFTSTTPLLIPGNVLHPGRNTVIASQMFIPASELDKDLTVSSTLFYRQSGPSYLQFTTDFDSQLVRVQPLPIAQVVLTRSIAPNAPIVNVNQPYFIRTRVANVSTRTLDSLVIRIFSDGTSIDTLYDTIATIAPQDTATIDFPVTPHEANPEEVFRVEIVSTHHGQLPPTDNIATVRVETPANLQVTNELKLTAGPQHFVETGAPFILSVSMVKFGQSAVTEGQYHLSTQGLDLGLPDIISGRDTIGDIFPDQQIDFELTAPNFDTTFTLRFTLTKRPTDLNTAQPAGFSGDSTFAYIIRVASTDAALFVSPTATPAAPVYSGQNAELFRLDLTNLAQTEVNRFSLDSIRLQFQDKHGDPLAVHEAINPTTLAFWDNGTKLTTAGVDGDMVTLKFDAYEIPADVSKSIWLRGNISADAGGAFGIRLDTSDVWATYLDGPAQGDDAPVNAPPNGGYILERFYSVSGPTLAQSFIIEDNPWHPGTSPARFAYTLTQESALEFRVFTLGGEQVFINRINSGASPLTTPGAHILEWDGLNGEGQMVHDGVYIVSLYLLRTGEEARIKVAVLK
ncbi:MAG: hypothetical protein NDJ18_04495 [candidate division Zixibacteria bacterium]|nr:hypothetical protein [candidate division Zixibacteria bacterium]